MFRWLIKRLSQKTIRKLVDTYRKKVIVSIMLSAGGLSVIVWLIMEYWR